MINVESGKNLIFIAGIMHRSGTNYLNNLLLLHPDCEYPGVVWEDFFLARADLLEKYTKSVENNWRSEWSSHIEDAFGSHSLLKCIGDGLSTFLKMQFVNREDQGGQDIYRSFEAGSKKMVTATPSIRNLDLFFKIFPKASLLIIIRDGRSIIESGVRSFGWEHENAMKKWADAAQTIDKFVQLNNERKHRYMVVKYEDLFLNYQIEIKKIIAFLEFDENRYDFEKGKNLYVMGSSDLMKKEGEVHWKRVKKNKDFNPMARWDSWERFLHERYNWIAGDAHEKIGYSKRTFQGNTLLWKLWNIVLDKIVNLESWLSWRGYWGTSLLKKIRLWLFLKPAG